ncbi:GNAT family N-acetyltransferase [Streptomyces noursei]|uniref:GNAT family N-acetyltransferase n=1 Tax=Streptomyces noursei TaxID=1971 RepID=UPI0030B7FA20
MRDRIRLPAGLCLRPWEPSDALAVLEAFAEPVMKRQADAPIATIADAEQWLQRRQDQWRRQVAYSFAVADSTNTALGGVAVSNLNSRHATGWTGPRPPGPASSTSTTGRQSQNTANPADYRDSTTDWR